MKWDDATRDGLDYALNESDVVGIRLAPDRDHVDVLLHVTALPETGPLVADGRRIMRLTQPTELQFLLRRDPIPQPVSSQPAIPLADEQGVEDFFDSLLWGGSIYGPPFLDAPDRTIDWPPEPSLRITVRPRSGPHTFYWFNECGAGVQDETASFCFEGTVTFEDIVMFDAALREIPIETFIADGVRFWDALFAGDRRAAVAQHRTQVGAPRWRRWARVSEH